MEKKPIFLGAVAYTLVTFPLAVVWHIVLFKPLYTTNLQHCVFLAKFW